jgi:site-specific DNA recombinase
VCLTATRLLAVFLRSISKQRAQPMQLLRPGFGLFGEDDARAAERLGPSITPQALKTFATQARRRMRTESGGYRRDHLRALAQRVEVHAKEVRIMGSKSVLLRNSSPLRAQKRRVLALPVCTEVARPKLS